MLASAIFWGAYMNLQGILKNLIILLIIFTGKKAKNKKATKVKMNLDDFLGDVQPGSNMAVVSLDWAAAMDDVEISEFACIPYTVQY